MRFVKLYIRLNVTYTTENRENFQSKEWQEISVMPCVHIDLYKLLYKRVVLCFILLSERHNHARMEIFRQDFHAFETSKFSRNATAIFLEISLSGTQTCVFLFVYLMIRNGGSKKMIAGEGLSSKNIH